MITNKIIMTRPYAFKFNEETASDNIYQEDSNKLSDDEIQKRALEEFDSAVYLLRKNKIHVDVIEDFDDRTPDSIFPNNVFVTFPGKIFVAQMYTENRNKEYEKLLPQLKKVIDFKDVQVINFKNDKGKVLEGTGVVVIDRWNSTAYASLSKRCDKDEFLKFADEFKLKPIYFKSKDQGSYIYHTNVMMSVSEKFTLIADELIVENKGEVLKTLRESGKEIISLTYNEFINFSANSIELKGEEKNLFVISKEGYNSLSPDKIKIIEKYDEILPIDVKNISRFGGGSIRCMIAENFI
ncbi:arginine deiminase-related protein [Peptoniphilus rhinitidis]|uniref:arginine deiminase-related protein n=1 Tax=Peptoniphilus rhinitidis TaxID=1175452 RepID=UPI002356A0CC|nr:arginine deiminase-related protein [Peptoniphilus rhinitidis]